MLIVSVGVRPAVSGWSAVSTDSVGQVRVIKTAQRGQLGFGRLERGQGFGRVQFGDGQ